MPELEDYVTPLMRVSDWPWQLFRITWINTILNHRRVSWVVSTDTHVDTECQDRWPSDYWNRVEWEAVVVLPEPPRVRSKWGIAHVDLWRHGAAEAARLKIPEIPVDAAAEQC